MVMQPCPWFNESAHLQKPGDFVRPHPIKDNNGTVNIIEYRISSSNEGGGKEGKRKGKGQGNEGINLSVHAKRLSL